MPKLHIIAVRAALILLCGTGSAWASYPSALPNEYLEDSLQGDSNRLIPAFERFSFAVDGVSYFRPVGREEFYHGIGYWIQARAEARVQEFFTINLRSIFYSGSISYGYVRPTGLYNLIGFSAVSPWEFLGGELSGRAMDLGRQTIGVGLLVQEKEMNGAKLTWARDGHEVILRGDGTGALVIRDDLFNLEVALFERLLGFGQVAWTEGIKTATSGGGDSLANQSETPLEFRNPYFYLFSSQDFFWLGYDFEVGMRGKSKAGLLALMSRPLLDPVEVELRVEVRRYEEGFGEDFAGQIEHDYISFDQYDKAYTNAMNVLARDDNADVFAAQVNLRYNLNEMWRFHSLNEIGQFAYRQQPRDTYYFFRHGVEFCPIEGRDDCITLLYSNKVMNETGARPDLSWSEASVPLFKSVNFFGAEASFRF